MAQHASTAPLKDRLILGSQVMDAARRSLPDLERLHQAFLQNAPGASRSAMRQWALVIRDAIQALMPDQPLSQDLREAVVEGAVASDIYIASILEVIIRCVREGLTPVTAKVLLTIFDPEWPD